MSGRHLTPYLSDPLQLEGEEYFLISKGLVVYNTAGGVGRIQNYMKNKFFDPTQIRIF